MIHPNKVCFWVTLHRETQFLTRGTSVILLQKQLFSHQWAFTSRNSGCAPSNPTWDLLKRSLIARGYRLNRREAAAHASSSFASMGFHSRETKRTRLTASGVTVWSINKSLVGYFNPTNKTIVWTWTLDAGKQRGEPYSCGRPKSQRA